MAFDRRSGAVCWGCGKDSRTPNLGRCYPRRTPLPQRSQFYTTRCERTVPSSYGSPNTRIPAEIDRALVPPAAAIDLDLYLRAASVGQTWDGGVFDDRAPKKALELRVERAGIEPATSGLQAGVRV